MSVVSCVCAGAEMSRAFATAAWKRLLVGPRSARRGIERGAGGEEGAACYTTHMHHTHTSKILLVGARERPARVRRGLVFEHGLL